MERFCFLMQLREGRGEEYDRRHGEVWPALVAELSAAGVSNYSLFRRADTVVAYAECRPDAATVFGRVGQTDVNRRWSEWFADVIERMVDEEGELLTATEVWHLA